MIQRTPRSGFTLLEVVLAMSLSVLMLAALYVSLSTHFHHARVGREVMNETNVVRGVVSKLNSDINGNLGPVNPFCVLLNNNAQNGITTNGNGTTITSISGSGTNSSSSSSSSSSGNSGSSSSSGGTSSGGGSSSSSGGGSSSSGSSNGGSSSNSNSNSTPTNPPVPPYVFNLGISGDNSSIVLMVSRTPTELSKYIGSSDTTPPDDPVSDLRRITYWMIDGKGLARQEDTNVTYADPMTVTAPPADTGNYTVMKEVKNMEVWYYGALASMSQPDWQTEWNGTAIDPTTMLPLGPPAAIKLKLTIQLPPSSAHEKEGRQTTIVQVIPIQAANRWVIPQMNPNSQNSQNTMP